MKRRKRMPEEPKGDISVFGTDQQVHESDSSLDAIEQEQHARLPEDVPDEGDGWGGDTPVYQAGPPEMDISVEDSTEADGDDEELEGNEFDQTLARFRTEPEQTTEEVSDGQMAERLAYQQGKLEALEEQIRARAATPAIPEEEAPKPKGAGINYQDPAIQAALAEAIEDPAKLGPTIAVLARKEAEALIESEVGGVKESLKKAQAVETDRQERDKVNAGITAGLQAAYKMGGLEAAIVKEAHELQDNSLLFQYIGNGNQSLATTPQGIMTAVLAVARAVERADAESPGDNTDTESAPAPVSSAKRSSPASKRGRELNKPKQKVSPEEEEKRRIVGTKKQISAIPFMQ